MVTIDVTTSDGRKISVMTEKSHESYSIEKITDGLNYESNLNKEGKNYYSEEDEYRMDILRQEIRIYYGNNFAIS